MGRLVCAIAMTHNPRIYWQAEAADAVSRERVTTLFALLRARLAAARPDRLVVIGNDHFDNFFLDTMPAFCVGVAERAEGPFWYEHEIMRIPPYRAPGDPEMGRQLLEIGVSRHIDFAQAGECRLDHAFCVPLSVVRPEADLPVMPLFTNTFAYPLATPQRCFEVGQAVRQLITDRPATERVAVVASFNLSLEVGGPQAGRKDLDLNRFALEHMRRGDVEALLTQLPVERLVAAGNSTAEFLNYDVLLGVVENRPPDLLEYIQVPAWGDCPAVLWNGG